jgi:hypothetical protein
MSDTPVHDRLKKKLKKRNPDKQKTAREEQAEQVDLFKMISQVQSVLQTNPEMVSKISSCLNTLMSNSDLMKQVSSEIEKNVQEEETKLTSSSTEQVDAASKQSLQ